MRLAAPDKAHNATNMRHPRAERNEIARAVRASGDDLDACRP